jgi:hypothetical protein
MEVDTRPTESLTPYENNPRINENGVDAVAASISEFGLRRRIVNGSLVHFSRKNAKRWGTDGSAKSI